MNRWIETSYMAYIVTGWFVPMLFFVGDQKVLAILSGATYLVALFQMDRLDPEECRDCMCALCHTCVHSSIRKVYE